MIVEWTDRALQRLLQIHDYIAADAPTTANEFCDLLIKATEQLETFPFSGALLPEDAAYRHLVVAQYRIVYRIAEDAVYVMTIVSDSIRQAIVRPGSHSTQRSTTLPARAPSATSQ